jgi:hypothetical protein
MLVRINKRLVDVVDSLCAKRHCFRYGEDKGTFVQGRGYTGYHKKPRPVCMNRHLNGCPHCAVCLDCRTKVLKCCWCGSERLEFLDKNALGDGI